MNLFLGRTIIIITGLFLLTAVIFGPDYLYTEEYESKESYSLPGIDEGLIQSPINIITSEVVEAKHHIEARYKPTHEDIIHKHNTIEVAYDSGSFILFDDREYVCNQFHFHTPSEHLIDGVTYPMELHLVHSNQNSKALENQYFVISVLFKMGKENKFLKYLEEDIPQEVGGEVEHEDIYFNISDLIANDLRDYYHYSGSLTTPPYLETVHWAVLSHVMEASPEQIARINELEGDNARHIQSVNGRRIELTHDR